MEKHAKKLMKSAKSNFSKAKRSYTCRSLKDLVRAYRACTTPAEERALVKKESAHIRDLFREGDKAFRRQNIAKLLFFHMNGYPTNFGMTECIKLCASPKYSDKRVAYLGLTILVDETADILMLMTNCLKHDLLSSDRSIVSLALTVLADIASAEMTRDLLPEIELHLGSQDSHLRKKALAAAVRAVRKLDADEVADLLVALPKALDAASAAAYVAAAAFVVECARCHPQTMDTLRDAAFVPLASALRALLLNGARAADTTISGVRNPFLTVKLLHALRVLTGAGAPTVHLETLAELVSHLATNTSSSHVVGCAVLYECVRVALAIPSRSPLRMSAIEILGGFLAHKLATIRYVALQELVKVCALPEEGRYVGQYRETILSCLAEADPTVSQMAVELVYGIANTENVEEMTVQLLEYLDRDHPAHHVEETCYKIFDMMDRFGGSMRFKVETFVTALEKVDLAMPENLITAFAAMVSENREAQVRATEALWRAGLMKGPCEVDEEGKEVKRCRKPRLERLALYIVGEYGDLAINETSGLEAHKVIDAIELSLKASPIAESSWIDNSSTEHLTEVNRVRETALGALAKLATRLDGGSGTDAPASGLESLGLGDSKMLALPPAPKQELGGLGGDLLAGLGISDEKSLVPVSTETTLMMSSEDQGDVLLRIRSMIAMYRKSCDLETQQRACEFSNLLTAEMAHVRGVALSRMPPIDFNQIKELCARRHAQNAPPVVQTESNDLLALIDDAPPSTSTSKALPAGSELLAITYEPSDGATASVPKSSLDDLLGLPSTNTPVMPVSSGTSTSVAPTGGSLALDDLLGVLPSSNTTSQDTQIANMGLTSIGTGAVELGKVEFAPTAALRGIAKFVRDDANDTSKVRVDVTFTNISHSPITKFVFQLAVPNGMSATMESATTSEIAIGSTLSQSSLLENVGYKKMRILYRVEYQGGDSLAVTQHQGRLNPLPVGL